MQLIMKVIGSNKYYSPAGLPLVVGDYTSNPKLADSFSRKFIDL